MFWHAMPPELNTARLMAGAGAAPMLQAAAAWTALGTALRAQAAELSASLAALKGSWTGIGSERATAAAAPMVAWLEHAAETAERRAAAALAQAAAYMAALGMTPSIPEIATNKISHTVLTATNFLGINTMPIGLNETDYFVRMWTQAGTAMDVYEAETLVNTTFEPLPEVQPIVAPGVSDAETASIMASVAQTVSDDGPTNLLGAASDAADGADDLTPTPNGAAQISQLMTGLQQLSGPMQQLMQPLQQLTSMAGQSGGMGSSTMGDGLTLGGTKLGELGANGAQMGLIGAPPLSSHPLLGGSGPSVGMGLMHAEALPGSGGSGPRTSMMSQLIDKPAAGVTQAGAGAGSSAAGGAAPMSAMGQGSQSGAAAKPGLPTATALAEHHDEEEPHDVDEGDDW